MPRTPLAIAILGMIGGVAIAVLFGINEDLFKDKIARGLQENPKVLDMPAGPEKTAYIAAESSKLWRYYQRFHFHSTGIGAMSLSVLLLLGLLSGGGSRLKHTAAYLVSVGGFLYPFVWLFAAVYGPHVGRGAAKERFALFGYMGGVFLIGLFVALYVVCRERFSWPRSHDHGR